MKAENGFKEFFILDLVPPIHSLNIIVKTKNIEHNEINAKNFVIPIITRYISKIIVNTNEGSILNNVAFNFDAEVFKCPFNLDNARTSNFSSEESASHHVYLCLKFKLHFR